MSKKLTRELIVQKVRSDKLGQIKNLNLWGNNIDNIDILAQMPSLEIVSLSVNKIKTLKPFAELTNLRELYLRNNLISDLNEIKYLIGCENLTTLWLSENPICQNKNYRCVIVGILPQLEKLDDVAITNEERSKAEQKLNGDYQSEEEEEDSIKNEEENRNDLIKSQVQHHQHKASNNKRKNYQDDYDVYEEDLMDKFQKKCEVEKPKQRLQSSKVAYNDKPLKRQEDKYEDDLYEKNEYEDKYYNQSSNKKEEKYKRFKSQRIPESRYEEYSKKYINNKYNDNYNDKYDNENYNEYEERNYRESPYSKQSIDRKRNEEDYYNNKKDNRNNSNILKSVMLLLGELNPEQLNIVKRECDRISQY